MDPKPDGNGPKSSIQDEPDNLHTEIRAKEEEIPREFSENSLLPKSSYVFDCLLWSDQCSCTEILLKRLVIKRNRSRFYTNFQSSYQFLSFSWLFIRDKTQNSGNLTRKSYDFYLTMGDTLNNASGASNSGMGRDDVGVHQPFPVDSDRLINTDFQNTNNNSEMAWVLNTHTCSTLTQVLPFMRPSDW